MHPVDRSQGKGIRMIDFAERRRSLALQGRTRPVWAVEVWNPLDGSLVTTHGAEPSHQAAYTLSLAIGRAIYAHLKTRIVRCAPITDDDGDGIPMLLAA